MLLSKETGARRLYHSIRHILVLSYSSKAFQQTSSICPSLFPSLSLPSNFGILERAVWSAHVF